MGHGFVCPRRLSGRSEATDLSKFGTICPLPLWVRAKANLDGSSIMGIWDQRCRIVSGDERYDVYLGKAAWKYRNCWYCWLRRYRCVLGPCGSPRNPQHLPYHSLCLFIFALFFLQYLTVCSVNMWWSLKEWIFVYARCQICLYMQLHSSVYFSSESLLSLLALRTIKRA